MEVIDDLSKTETDNVYLVDFRIAGLNMTHLKHDHKSKPQGQQMPVETGKMTLTISKLRVPYKNKKLQKKVYHLHMQLPISSECSPSISTGLTIGRIFLK